MSGASVTITLNGRPHALERGRTLADLLARLDLHPLQVATAVNDDFVPRAARAACVLREGDRVMTFQPIVGG